MLIASVENKNHYVKSDNNDDNNINNNNNNKYPTKRNRAQKTRKVHRTH